MREHLLRYECDNCHKIAEESQNTGLPLGKMPKDWLRVSGYSNSHKVFNLDLCEVCKQDIMKFTNSA